MQISGKWSSFLLRVPNISSAVLHYLLEVVEFVVVLMKIDLPHFLWFILPWTNLYVLTCFPFKICNNLYYASNAYSNSFQQFKSQFIPTEYHYVASIGLVGTFWIFFLQPLSHLSFNIQFDTTIFILVLKDERAAMLSKCSWKENLFCSD